MKKKGISLITLIVTIVIIIILATIVILTLVGPNGIIRRANEAIGIYNFEVIKEEVNIIWSKTQILKLTNQLQIPVREDFGNRLKENDPNATVTQEGEILYVYYKGYDLELKDGVIVSIEKNQADIVDIAPGPVDNSILALDTEGKLTLRHGRNEYNTRLMYQTGMNYENFNPLQNEKIMKAVEVRERDILYIVSESGGLYSVKQDRYSLPICLTKDTSLVLYGKKIIDVITVSGCVIALDDQGNVYTWGGNYSGQLGDGTPIPGKDEEGPEIQIPRCINNVETSPLHGKKITRISSVGYTIFAIDVEGKLYAWGDNSYGQIGIGTTSGYLILPVSVSDTSILKDKKITAINSELYGSKIMVLDSDGKLYTWGRDINSKYLPLCISDETTSPIYNKKIVDFICDYVNAAIDSEGKLYMWGSNQDGLLGIGNDSDYYSSDTPICLTDMADNALYGKKVVKIQIGYDQCIALDSDGLVYTWGRNTGGQLGDGTTTNSNKSICISIIANHVFNDKKIVDVVINNEVVAIDITGKVYVWGGYKDLFSTIGSSSGKIQCPSDDQHSIIYGKKMIKVKYIDDSCLLLDENGKLYYSYKDVVGCVSDKIGNIYSQKISKLLRRYLVIDEKGYLYFNENNINEQIQVLKDVKVVEASYEAILDDQGKIYCWDDVTSSLICVSDNASGSLYQKRIVQISKTRNYALDAEGKIHIFDSTSSQCFNDQENNILKNKIISKICEGDLVIDTVGKVYSLTDMICLNDTFPILNTKSIVDAKVYDKRTRLNIIMLLDSDGKIYTMGSNDDGRLGDGTTTDSSTFICISDIAESTIYNKKMTQMSAQEDFIVAVDENQIIYIWGLGKANGYPIILNDILIELAGKKFKIIKVEDNLIMLLDTHNKLYLYGDNRRKE